jgi:hypothetical protein
LPGYFIGAVLSFGMFVCGSDRLAHRRTIDRFFFWAQKDGYLGPVRSQALFSSLAVRLASSSTFFSSQPAFVLQRERI